MGRHAYTPSFSNPAAGRFVTDSPKRVRRTRDNSSQRPIPSDLQLGLMKLNAAQEARDFWESTKELLHRALPLEFCCVNFRLLLTSPAMTFRERVPFASEEEFQRDSIEENGSLTIKPDRERARFYSKRSRPNVRRSEGSELLMQDLSVQTVSPAFCAL
jgi:hypothetical protein